jgi:RNA polymerase sigma factor (sigma-70 family)
MERQIESADKSGLEHHLKQLARAAQSYPPGSLKRRRCLNNLFRILQNSGKLYRTHSSFQNYSECYEDALQSTFMYVAQNIDLYKPEMSSFLTWFNNYLRWRILDLSRANMRQMQVVSLDEKLLDELPSQATLTAPSMLEKLEEYIQKDPSGYFRNTHLRDRPDANLQHIMLKRLDGLNWIEIANELSVTIPTLSSFYQRSLRRFAPAIRREIKDS